MAMVMLTLLRVVPGIVCTAFCCCMPPVLRAHDGDDDDDTHILISGKLHGRAGASEAAIDALSLFTFVTPPHLPSALSSPLFQDSLATQHSVTSCNAKATSCCICLESYAEDVRVRELPCFHRFHMACVDEWLRISATCPLCRYAINQFTPEELVF